MTRPLRVHLPGVPCHVMSRGNARQEIFLDDEDYRHFLRRLTVVVRRFRARCYSYCLMVNHFHLLLEPGELPLSRLMQQLNSSYTQWFNRRHARVGHVLQGRPKMLLINRDDYFRRVLRYIARNPVRANLVASPANWPWSTYRATAGLEQPAGFLVLERVWDVFAPGDVRYAQRLYRAFVDDLDCAEDGDPLERGPLGDDRDLARRVEAMLARHRDDREIACGERFAGRPPLGRLFTCGRDRASRDRFMLEAFDRHGYTLREIGDFIGRHPNTVWKRIRRARLTSGVDDLRGENPDLTP